MNMQDERKNSGIPVIDLFAGAGGLGLGAKTAGADVRLSVEIDHICCETIRQNLSNGHQVAEADVSELSGGDLRRMAGISDSDPLVIVGGPPCQPFSKAAYWTDPGDDSRFRRARRDGRSAPKPRPITTPKPDERRSLVDEFWRLVRGSKAEGFVFENVPSILHPRNRKTFLDLRAAFEKIGYKTSFDKVNAVEYGVPQRRTRVFLLGAKRSKPEIPAPTHTMENKGLFLKRAVTAGEAIEPFASDEFFEPEEVVKGKWAEQLFEIEPGWNYKYLTEWAKHPEPVFEAERRFWNFLLKLSPDIPSWTIAANPGPWTGPFHWENRRLRTVELAALQGFQADYSFSGSRRERVRQIGNAVPPPLAKQMIGAVLDSVIEGRG